MAKNKPSVIELFCGAGGTSYGFQNAGFDVRLGLDHNEDAIATFKLNHRSAIAMLESVENVSGFQLLQAAKLDSVDVLVGGPSCQGYSTMGPRLEDDPRNFLFTHYLRLVGELKPRWIVFENVKGMKFHGNGKFFHQLCAQLGSLGYRVGAGILNAADFGVPQRRERLIVLGTRDDCEVSLPSATHQDPRCSLCSRPDRSNRVRAVGKRGLFGGDPCPRCSGSGREPDDLMALQPWVTVAEAIGDLPVLGEDGGTEGFTPYSKPATCAYQIRMRSSAKGYTLHKARPVSDFARSVIELVPEGSGLRAVPADKLPARFKVMRTVSNGQLRRDCTTLYHRLSRGLPAYTITCSFTNVASGAFVHPTANRAITSREAARFQSFPDSFGFSKVGLKDQIGNAVPPLLAEAIAREIRRALIARRRTTQTPPKRNNTGSPGVAMPQARGLAWRQGSLELHRSG